MTEENPDDLIEATIRRVAEAKARLEAASPARKLDPPAPDTVDEEPGPPADDSTATVDIEESVIEATIRRVAAAKAAQASVEAPQPEVTLEVPTAPAEPPTQKIAPSAEPRIDDAPATAQPREAPRAAGSDDRAFAPAQPPEAPRAADSDDRAFAPAQPPEAPTAGRDDRAFDARPLEAAIARLEQELADVRQALHALSARVDLELARAPLAESRDAAAPVGDDDDDWDDEPVLQSIPAGPPRPAILRDPVLRDPPPEPAPMARADEIEIDTRPLPEPPPPIRVEPRRGLDLLPRTYRITVEDKRRGVDLVPLHRALLGMECVRDMSLLSFANGVAIVSLETIDELDPRVLEESVSRAMSRPAKAEVHNEQTMVVKLAEE